MVGIKLPGSRARSEPRRRVRIEIFREADRHHAAILEAFEAREKVPPISFSARISPDALG